MQAFESGRRLLFLSFVLVVLVHVRANASESSFLGSFHSVTQFASTVPRNGDVNPYGVAAVPSSTGALVQGHILVSNFNNRKNLQGTGTTIVDVAPDGTVSLFASIDARRLPGPCPGGVGLTTALVVLKAGWVVVGSLPTTDGTAATAQAGCLLVLNSTGQVVETLSGGAINGPWDMTALDGGSTAALFVTNVLNGTVAAGGNVINQATVVRILLSLPDQGVPVERSRTVIASGFPSRTDPAALVIGPTGVGLGANGTLYVADTLESSIAAISNAITRTTTAGTGSVVSSGGAINGPLGLAIAPNGNILTTNGGDGNIVETTPQGKQVFVEGIDLSGMGAGTLFGLCIAPGGTGVYFVDDGNNFLDLIH
jgi:hypothetical protein